jgi:hypothetical protein
MTVDRVAEELKRMVSHGRENPAYFQASPAPDGWENFEDQARKSLDVSQTIREMEQDGKVMRDDIIARVMKVSSY